MVGEKDRSETVSEELTAPANPHEDAAERTSQADALTEEYLWADVLEVGDRIPVKRYVELDGEPAVEITTGNTTWGIYLPSKEPPLSDAHLEHCELALSDQLVITDLKLDDRTVTVEPDGYGAETITVDIVPPSLYEQAASEEQATDELADELRTARSSEPFTVTGFERANAETVTLTAQKGGYEATFRLAHALEPDAQTSELAQLVETTAAGDITQLRDGAVAVAPASNLYHTHGTDVVTSVCGNWGLLLEQDPYELPVWPADRYRHEDSEASTKTAGRQNTEEADARYLRQLQVATIFLVTSLWWVVFIPLANSAAVVDQVATVLFFALYASGVALVIWLGIKEHAHVSDGGKDSGPSSSK